MLGEQASTYPLTSDTGSAPSALGGAGILAYGVTDAKCAKIKRLQQAKMTR